jgi:hypothetical protein
MKNSAKDVADLLKKNGFTVEVESSTVITAKFAGMVNPADVRSKVAEVLHQNGYKDYYLKEAYAYRAAKRPWRTDEEGFVEIALWASFEKGALPQTHVGPMMPKESKPLTVQRRK